MERYPHCRISTRRSLFRGEVVGYVHKYSVDNWANHTVSVRLKEQRGLHVTGDRVDFSWVA